MPSKSRASLHRIETYYDQTQRPLNCLWFVLPIILTYHLGALWCGTGLLAPRDIAKLLQYFGARAWWYLPGSAVIVVLLLQHWFQHRRCPWRPRVLLGMFVESLVGVLPLIVIDHLTGMVMSQLAAGDNGQGVFRHVLIALGAGLYEEFVFRLVFISVVLLVLVDVLGLKQRITAPVAVVLSATLFSLYHFRSGRLDWGSFPWSLFIFRTVAGCYLGGLYVLRGFGIAVGAHIFWNLYTMLWRL